MTDPSIRTEHRDDILHVILDRPAQRNAMSDALVAELIDAIHAFEADDAARVMVLSGSGNGFCAGSDVRGLAAMNAAQQSAFEEASGRVARMLTDCPKPVVAAVHGFAIGGGFTLAIAADIVVTDAAAKWSLPEVPIGLFPAWGLGAVERRCGVTAARRLSWGIDTLDGAEAVRVGLADILAEVDALGTAFEIATRLAALPQAQARAVKRYFAGRGDDAAADARANDAFMATVPTAEAQASFVRFGGKA